jgi:hypothetical protein
MAKKKIFIGSSSEQRKDLAEKLAEELADSGFIPLPWWQAFPSGSITVPRLKEIAGREADAAVLIFSGDDETTQRGVTAPTARDNVIFESGLFAATFDLDRLVILCERDIRLPSDLLGITHIPLTEGSTSATKVCRHLKTAFSSQEMAQDDAIPITADPKLLDVKLGGAPPDHWNQRLLWLNPKSARIWSKLQVLPQEHMQLLVNRLVDALATIDVRRVVSFGTKSGSIDRALCDFLLQHEPTLEYVPVDTNEAFLKMAFETVSEVASVPFALLTDFEDRMPWILRQLDSIAEKPTLYLVLGNALGLVDGQERRLVNGLYSAMRSDDVLLMDVGLHGSSWTPGGDPRGTLDGYPEGHRRLIAEAISARTGESVSAIMDTFQDRIEFEYSTVDDSLSSSGSDVPGTRIIHCRDRSTKTEVFKTRRYEWDRLRQWFEKNWSVKVSSGSKPYWKADSFGTGVLLLMKSGSRRA